MSFLFSQPAPGIVPIDSISFAELAKVDASSVLGNPSGSLADASSITFTNLTSLLDPFAGTLQGLVPASSNTGTLFLRDDGTWVAAGGGLPTPTIPTDAAKVVAVDSSGVASWQYAGLGDGNFSTASLILGRGKPTSSTGTKLTLLGTLAGNSLTSGNASVLIGDIGKSITTGLGNIFIGYEYIDGFPQSGYQPVAATTASVGIGISLRATGSNNVAIGYFANTISDSVAIGSHVTAGTNGAYGGVNHVAIGSNATIYAGNNCVAIGYGAFSANSTQIAIGAGASSGGNDVVLGPATGAVNNVVIGASSGYFRNTGGNNTVVGSSSFNSASLTTAANNTILGQGSATALTTGTSNVIIGKGTATLATTLGTAFSTGNVIIGNEAMTAATNPEGSVVIGFQAATSTVANWSTIIGSLAGSGSAFGDSAVAIGHRSLAGQNSTAIGTNASTGSNAGSVAIGHVATAGIQAIALGKSATAPDNTFAVGSNNAKINTVFFGRGGDDIGTGTGAHPVTISCSRVQSGWPNVSGVAGTLTLNGANSTGNQPGGDVIIKTAPAGTAGSTANAYVEVMRVTANGNVGIGTSTPSAKLDVTNGDIAISTEGKGLAIKTGANAKIGKETFPSPTVGTLTVNTEAVTANSLIFLTGQTGFDAFSVDNIVPSTGPGTGSFDIVHSTGNVPAGEVVAWMIVEATP